VLVSVAFELFMLFYAVGSCAVCFVIYRCFFVALVYLVLFVGCFVGVARGYGVLLGLCL